MTWKSLYIHTCTCPCLRNPRRCGSSIIIRGRNLLWRVWGRRNHYERRRSYVLKHIYIYMVYSLIFCIHPALPRWNLLRQRLQRCDRPAPGIKKVTCGSAPSGARMSIFGIESHHHHWGLANAVSKLFINKMCLARIPKSSLQCQRHHRRPAPEIKCGITAHQRTCKFCSCI